MRLIPLYAIFSRNFCAKLLHTMEQIFLQRCMLGIAVKIVSLSRIPNQIVHFELLRFQIIVDELVPLRSHASIWFYILPARILEIFVEPLFAPAAGAIPICRQPQHAASLHVPRYRHARQVQQHGRNVGIQDHLIAHCTRFDFLWIPDRHGDATIPRSYLEASYPQYTSVLLSFITGGYELYNSVQLKLNKRFSHGFDLLASFTGQKQMDDYSGIITVGNITGGIQNIYHLNAEYAVSSNDISRSLVISGIYALPFGRA